MWWQGPKCRLLFFSVCCCYFSLPYNLPFCRGSSSSSRRRTMYAKTTCNRRCYRRRCENGERQVTIEFFFPCRSKRIETKLSPYKRTSKTNLLPFSLRSSSSPYFFHFCSDYPTPHTTANSIYHPNLYAISPSLVADKTERQTDRRVKRLPPLTATTTQPFVSLLMSTVVAMLRIISVMRKKGGKHKHRQQHTNNICLSN